TETNWTETLAVLRRRLRLATGCVALIAGIAELAGSWSLEQQVGALSRFAEAALSAALRHLLRAAHQRGAARLADPQQPEQDSGLIVLGMGKLGGGERNYSSDIDLILLFHSAQNAVIAPDHAHAF